MGLFGSSTKTYYSSTAVSLYEDMPPLVKQTAVAAIMQNRNIAEDLVANLVNGTYWNAKRLYNYGLNGGYEFGLPEGSISNLSPQSYSYVKYAIEADIGEPVYVDSVVLDTDTNTSHVLYKAKYHLLDSVGNATGALLDWVYDESTGRYPVLDIPKDDESLVSPYFPVIPIRVNGVSQVDASVLYAEDIKAACRYLRLDPEQINTAIEESASDATDPQPPADDAYVILGVDVTNDSSQAKEYLYRYFEYMDTHAQVTERDYDYWAANQSGETPPMNVVRIADSNYKMELGWLYTVSATLTGTLTADYEKEFFAFGEQDAGSTGTTYSNDTLVLRKRINATTYKQLTVHGLVHSNWAVGQELRTTMSAAFNDPDGIAQSFIIPIRQDVANEMVTPTAHDLMTQSVRLVINDEVKVKLKWYQTGFFRFVVLVAAVATSIFYPPAGVAALSASAVGIAMTQVIIAKVLFPIAYKALADLVGEELALLVSVLAVMYGYSGSGVVADTAVTAGSLGVGASYQPIGQKNYEAFQEEMTELEEGINLYEESAEERRQDILNVSRALSGDSYAILTSDDYVRKFRYEHKKPTLIRDTTHQYAETARFTDRPASYIRLGA